METPKILKSITENVSAAEFGGCFCFFRLNYQPHILHTVAVSRSGGDNINSGRVDAAVTENIRKLGNILFNSVKHTGKQVAQIMRKYLLRVDVCFLA